MSYIQHFRQKHPLCSFILFRLLQMFCILFVLGLCIFALMSLTPGDIVDRYARIQMFDSSDSATDVGNATYSDSAIAREKERLGLHLPFYQQYFRWLYNVFIRGDLGKSMISRAPILFLIQERMINTLVLNVISLIFLTFFSFIVGIYFSSRAHTPVDVIAGGIAIFLHAFPSILLLILMQVFAAQTGLFPITAYPNFRLQDAPVRFVFSYLHHIVLPLFAAFLSGIGGTMRVLRAVMLDQLGKPYITSLRSRGIPEKRIYLSHAFRNTLNPFITGSANIFAGLFSGSLILEIIFSYPGMGRLMYEAVLMEDINLVLANFMFISFLALVGITTSDILLAVFDPRIKYGKH